MRDGELSQNLSKIIALNRIPVKAVMWATANYSGEVFFLSVGLHTVFQYFLSDFPTFVDLVLCEFNVSFNTSHHMTSIFSLGL
jgi:hypothetical protein